MSITLCLSDLNTVLAAVIARLLANIASFLSTVKLCLDYLAY